MLTSDTGAGGVTVALAARVAAFDLGGARAPLSEAPLAEPEFRALLSVCLQEATVGLLSAAVATGALPAVDRQVDLCQAAHAHAMGVAVVLEQLLVSSSTTLTDAGVEHRLLKGPSFAHLDWPDPALRSFNDIDLLVAGDSDRALAALVAAGCTRRTAEVSAGFDHRFGKGTTMVAPSGYEIDVHRTLVAGAYGQLIKLDELFDGAVALSIGGTTVSALGRPQRLVHACYHAALGDVRPKHATCRDVAELALHSQPHEVDAALQLARSWASEAVLARALVLAADLLELPGEHRLIRWSRAYEPSRGERRRLQAYSGPSRSFARQAAEGFLVLPTMGDRIAYGRLLAFPSRDHLAERNETTWARLVNTARVLSRRVNQ